MENEDTNCRKICKEALFIIEEYDIALSGMKLKSALGLDQIDSNIIFSLTENYANLILQIYNRILSVGYFSRSRDSH